MNVNKVLTRDYEEKCGKDLWKNEPKTNPIKANFTSAQKGKTAVRGQMSALGPLFSVNERGEKNRSPRLLIDPMLPLYPVRKPALRAETVSFTHLTKQPGSNMSDEFSNGVYKPGNDQYYIRYICRCSSMVERSFRKAEVVGPTPTIGCGFVCERVQEGVES